MSAFNPYREWLELDDDLPASPSYYQLFRLDDFECDPSKITHAADRAIAKVRSCRPGQHADQWSKMLDELTAAKSQLLIADRKAAYDQKLRESHATAKLKNGDEPQMRVDQVAHADPNFTKNFFPPETTTSSSDQRETTTPASSAMTQPATPESNISAAQAPYQPSAPTPAAASPTPALSPAAQAPYQPPTSTPTAMPAPGSVPTATAYPAAPSPQQPYQPTTPPAALPAAAAPYQPSAPMASPSAGVPVALPAMNSPMAGGLASAPVGVAPAAPNPTAPLAAPASPTTPTTAPLASAAMSPVPVANPAMQSPAAAPQLGGKQSVASQQRGRGQLATQTLPIIAVGAALVLLLGGVVWMGLTSGGNDVAETDATSDPVATVQTPATPVVEDNTPAIPTRPTLKPSTPPEDAVTLSAPPPTDATDPTSDTSPFETDDPTDTSQPQPPAMESTPSKPDTPPTKPEPVTPPPATPEPPAEPEPMKPNPKPVAPPAMPKKLDDAQLKELSSLLTTARKAIGEKDFDFADTQIAKAEALAVDKEHRAKATRLRQLSGYVREYWNVVSEALGELEGTEELPYRDSVIVIVEKTPTKLTIRYRGLNRSYSLDELPAGIAMAIADQWFDESEPANLVFKGAWGLVMPNGSDAERKKARGWWDEALRKGVDISEFMKVADDTYDFAEE